jgi:hypothetical protein
MNSDLNCQTPAGQEWLRKNRLALKAIERQTGLEFLGISNDEPSRIDGFIHDPLSQTIIGSYEIKTRAFGLDKLRNIYGNRWLISWSKLYAISKITKDMRIPFYGILHLLEDDLVLKQEIFNKNGSWAANHHVVEKAVNGRTEQVALIDMRNAEKYKISANAPHGELF